MSRSTRLFLFFIALVSSSLFANKNDVAHIMTNDAHLRSVDEQELKIIKDNISQISQSIQTLDKKLASLDQLPTAISDLSVAISGMTTFLEESKAEQRNVAQADVLNSDSPSTCEEKSSCAPKPEKMLCCPAYSAPFDRNLPCGWDVYTTASFIYWQAQEENLDLGLLSNSLLPLFLYDPVNNLLIPPSTSNVIHPDFSYKPGFQFGIGFNTGYDSWDVLAEYTWFHGTTRTTESNPHGSGFWLFPSQGVLNIDGIFSADNFDGHHFYGANQSWNLKTDFVDLTVGRAYYSGMKLTVRPFVGARGAWIRQKMIITYTGSAADGGIEGHSNAKITNQTVSQGFGPTMGFDSNWLVGCGWRLIGNASADILYTQYNYAYRLFQQYVTGTPIADALIQDTTEAYLRTHAAMEMGFGWGQYLGDSTSYVDLSATYNFQVFWDQNMFRGFSSAEFGKGTTPNGNLYMQGLTANIRLDF